MQDFDRTGGNKDSTLGGHTQSSARIRTQGEETVTPKEAEPDQPASAVGSPAEAGGGNGSPWGRHWQQKFWEVILGVNPPGDHHWYHQRASRYECWVTSGETANREGTQAHAPANKWIKVLLSSAHQSNTQLYPPEQHPALSTTTSPSHQEACTSLFNSLIHQKVDSRSKKNYNTAACGMKTTFRER